MNDTPHTTLTEDSLREVSRSPRARRIREQGLVLQAMGIGHQVVQPAGAVEAVILVEPPDEARAREELDAYDRENRAWPVPEELPEVLSDAALGVTLWSVTLLLISMAERNRLLGLDWWERGKLIASEVNDGAWWRTLTALTLHDDLVHLTSNIVFGALFVGIVCQVMGTGLALFSVVASGFLGNLVNAAIQGDGFSAIGASTAVFGALGILGGSRYFSRTKVRSTAARRRATVSLLACVFLLGAYGSGGGEPGSRIDVLGHVCGFLAGLSIGAAYGRLGSGTAPGERGQIAWGLGALAALAIGWWLALA